MLAGGLGALVQSFVMDYDLKTTVKRIGIDDQYVEQGSVTELLEEVGLTKENIVNKIEEIISNEKN